MEHIILETHITNLVRGRRVRWLSDQGEWLNKGETRVFKGAYPSMCRDQAAAEDCEREWEKGMVKLTIRTNLRVNKEKTPVSVDKAEKFARKEGRDKETADQMRKAEEARQQAEDMEKKRAALEKKKREEYEEKRQKVEQRRAEALSDSEKMNPEIPGDNEEVPIHPIDNPGQNEEPVNVFQANPLK